MSSFHSVLRLYTDKKEKKIFLVYTEIQKKSVAKPYMTNGLLIYGSLFSHFLIYSEALPHLRLCNPSHLNFRLYEENFLFFFIKVDVQILDKLSTALLKAQPVMGFP
jgi:hypothetical protein